LNTWKKYYSIQATKYKLIIYNQNFLVFDKKLPVCLVSYNSFIF